MGPMSNTKRQVYFFTAIVFFLIVTPFVLFYALGYRFDFAKKFFITERGGVYVYVSIPGTDIYFNDKLEDTTGLFNKEYFSQNIKPGRYFVRAEKEGYRTWAKYIQVNPQKVSSVYPFLVPEIFDFEEIPQFIESTSAGTTTIRQIENSVYNKYLDLFAVDEEAIDIVDVNTDISSDEKDLLIEEGPKVIRRVFGDIQVWYDDAERKFYAEWIARGDFLPSYFCENGQCPNPFIFLEVNSPVSHFDFYPGRDDVIIFAVRDGSIHAIEADKRPQQTMVEIYRGNSNEEVKFSLSGRDTLVIKDGSKIMTTKLIR